MDYGFSQGLLSIGTLKTLLHLLKTLVSRCPSLVTTDDSILHLMSVKIKRPERSEAYMEDIHSCTKRNFLKLYDSKFELMFGS